MLIRIPLHDTRERNSSIASELTAAMRRVVEAGDLILGRQVAMFEERFAGYCGTDHCVSTGNATDGFMIAFSALRLGPGDEVIVPANAHVSPALAARHLGGKVVCIDPLQSTLLIDAESVAASLSEKTKVVVAVHLYGAMCNMAALKSLCAERKIALIEDFSQAQGAALSQGRAGAFGDVSICSFYPTKPLGALGDGGAILTNDVALKDELTALREYGWRVRDDASLQGFNSRLDELQAAVLNLKLDYLDDWNQERTEKARRLRSLLLSLEWVKLPEPVEANIYHLFPVLVEDRPEMVRRLNAAGFDCGIHYPIPIHRQGLFREENEMTSLPVSEATCDKVLSLPMTDPKGLVAAVS
jgi:dTDP-4-amino-4,6-dideoxygalactose transaminase